MALVPGNPGGSAGANAVLWQYREAGNLFTDTVTDKEAQSLFFLGSTLLTPAGWVLRGPTVGSFVLWKGRQGLLLLSSLKYGKESSLIVDGSSSHGLVQNGGPSAPPPLVQSGQLSDILSLGKISRPQSAHGRSSRTSATRRQRCPPGHYWSKKFKRCMPTRSHIVANLDKYNRKR